MKTKCMSCGGSMKKMAIGGTTTKRIIKKSTGGMYGIPQENMGTSDQYGFGQKGGTVKKPLKKTRIIDSKIPMKGPGAPVYKPLLAKKGGAVKYKTGGATKAAKFAALAPPYDKATFADKIVGAKKSAGSKKLPKAQLGAIVKGVIKYGSKGAKIGARAAQKNKALTMQAKRLSNLEKVAPGSKRKLIDKVMLNKVTNSERKQIANLFDRVSKVERTRAFNKDLKKVGLVSGGVMGALGLAAKYINDQGKYISDKVKDVYGVDKKKKKK